ncbi:hypothetical protein ACH4VM_33210 [Streptomyces sp. NPDC020792]|uniref:hypothetical protein n=1 Tax=Streptomyces sp. NPDC020792 TaxID=3365089 RepID=UPI00379A1D47
MPRSGRSPAAVTTTSFVGLRSVTQQGYHMFAKGSRPYLIGVGGTGICSFAVLRAAQGIQGVQGVYMGSSSLKRGILGYASLYRAQP